ncbi:MAG: Ni/Fe-hydrogenase, b-type cytochrome subunit [Vicinamibacterales bacterium]
MSKHIFRRLYLWEWPVRIYHWITAAAVAVLAATGLLIGAPVAFMTTGDASAGYWFGTVRFLHFAAAYLFFFAFVLRVYWLFVGNRHARWSAFVPVQHPVRFLRDLWDVVRTDILQLRKPPLDFVGHNPLAATTYFFIFLLTAFQIATGFALYTPMSASWVPAMFAWVTPLMGGDANVRIWHHAATWAFLVFAAIHVYLVLYHDVVEARGELSSMIGGSRFVEHHEEHARG